jgi:hypothetical protein
LKKSLVSWAAGPALLLALWGMTLVACAADTTGGAATEKKATAETGTEQDFAATIGGEKITLGELDQHLRRTNTRAFQEYYQARRAALDQLISERLIAAEAAARGISEDQLQQEALSAAPPVTDADVEGWYNQNKARVQNRTLDQMRQQIRNFLVATNQREAMADYIKVLRGKAGVQIHLEPPRVEAKIAANDPSRGPETAPVVIVEFSDFQ